MKKKFPLSPASFGVGLLLLFLLASCSPPAKTTRAYRAELESLFSEQSPESYTTRFLLTYQLNQLYLQEGDYQGALVFFATERLGGDGRDPYRSFYYYLLGQIYEKNNQPEVAVLYYETIVREFADLEVNKQSIHKIILEKLLNLEKNPYLREQYNAILLERFTNKNNLADTSFWNYRMAIILESLGRWEEAMTYYQTFLNIGYFNLPECVTRQNPNVVDDVRTKIMLRNSTKSWLSPTLDELVANIKSSVWGFNPVRLERLRSQNNFFIHTWNHQLETAAVETDNMASSNIDALGFFREFLSTSRNAREGSLISFAENFNTESSEKLLYLGSYGWARISQWYFVFRQIDYPLDPELNGSWEWIGIYLGEKP